MELAYNTWVAPSPRDICSSSAYSTFAPVGVRTLICVPSAYSTGASSRPT